jgi:hypothetical protein
MPNVTYRKSQFNRKDYHKLFDYAPSGLGLKTILHVTNYRDKRVQRELSTETVKVLHAALEDTPMYINSKVDILPRLKSWDS